MLTAPRPVDGLELNEVADGLVVYDPAREAVHYLNSSAAVVFALCDGSTLPARIEELYGSLLSDTGGTGSARQCLDELSAKGLLQ